MKKTTLHALRRPPPGLITAIILLTLMGFSYGGGYTLRFALNDEARRLLTPGYSFALMTNFGPRDDYRNDIRQARGTVCIMAGQDTGWPTCGRR